MSERKSLTSRRRRRHVSKKSHYGRKRPAMRRRRRRPIARFKRVNGPVSDRIVVKLKYIENIELPLSSAGEAEYHTFSCNSAFDPNTSGTGHQPFYWDIYQALYDQYTVLGSKIAVTFTNSAGSYPVVVGIQRDSETAATLGGSAAGVLAEMPHSKYTTITSNNAASASKTITHKFSAKQSFNVDPRFDDDYWAAPTANPATQWYYNVFSTAAYSGQFQPKIYCQVTIHYVVAFWDIHEQSPSLAGLKLWNPLHAKKALQMIKFMKAQKELPTEGAQSAPPVSPPEEKKEQDFVIIEGVKYAKKT